MSPKFKEQNGYSQDTLVSVLMINDKGIMPRALSAHHEEKRNGSFITPFVE